MKPAKYAAWAWLITSGAVLLLLAGCLATSQPSPPNPTATFLLPTSTLTTSPTTPAVQPAASATATTQILRTPTPTLDFSRLDEPPLPPDPTQYEIGRHLFWLNCMTCHGERGQGLTDEFRSLYVEDANCWKRGCHAGNPGDQGFPIPRTIPAIISSNGDLPPFATPQALFEYLRKTHPPQNPGFMPDSDYWALTAYLWIENGRMSPGTVLEP